MPDIESRERNQYGTLWQASGIDNYGRVILDSPVELNPSNHTGVRFINTQNTSIDPQGRVIGIDATLITDRDIPDRSIFFPGRLTEFTDESSQLYEIIVVDNTPDIRNRQTRYECKLRKYSKKLPTLDS